jgi:membrane fusion protein, multidrug efflux system
VTGRIIAVHVVDDQPIKTGDSLVTIDPEPFSLAVAQRTAEVEEATAEIAGDRDALTAAEDLVKGARSAAELAQVSQRRVASLAGRGDTTAQRLGEANDDLQRMTAALGVAEANVARACAQAAPTRRWRRAPRPRSTSPNGSSSERA